MLHIKKILHKTLNASSYKKGVEASRIIETAEQYVRDLFPPAVAIKIRPAHVKNRILSISCDSPAVVQEASFHKQQLMNYINEHLGSGTIKNIRFQIG